MTPQSKPTPVVSDDELLHRKTDYMLTEVRYGRMSNTAANKIIAEAITAYTHDRETEARRKAILETWYYTGEGYNGEYDGLTYNGGKRYSEDEVEAKVLSDVLAQLKAGEKHDE